ncbi:MAG TPA: methylenetetrahydrofolate--tRNA-(uracil(54)-C(5))-methyltransferase (FADH(2)-oxidizing) TrmFO, partial [Terriglobales bacterium]|nr:methylenetetrahydrofolate--tRNA-(uracil(54)-C(5))-methyltransferase (FADH(2)-oxidizing) TrmFO [Terriglobales bacterium]
GSEAAWQCARRGILVDLYEMRPVRNTPAHQTSNFAELVCSNSLKSDSENTAPWLLKEEMRRAGSLLLEIAREAQVPAGHALAVDRDVFARKVTEALKREPLIRIYREEITRIDEAEEITVVATGPLTSDALAAEIQRLSAEAGQPGTAAPREPARLFFYDSISPIVDADSIDMSRVYMAARYDKGTADYINCPFTKEEYDRFYDGLISAQSVDSHDWENLNYFESCLPIEEIARRGRDTLRFGPMKPVGLRNPQTGQTPYAVVQLRQENLRADSYNIVGFQNHLKYGDQARVLRLIPGLENARFLRYGQIHRNTYINSPALLTQTLQMRQHPNVIFAGQISGVEGYVESVATGLIAGLTAAALAQIASAPKGPEARCHTGAAEAAPLPSEGDPQAGRDRGKRDSQAAPLQSPPRATAFGSLIHYITRADPRNFQPANITFDLLPPWEQKIRDKKERHRLQCERALRDFDEWLEQISTTETQNHRTF